MNITDKINTNIEHSPLLLILSNGNLQITLKI